MTKTIHGCLQGMSLRLLGGFHGSSLCEFVAACRSWLQSSSAHLHLRVPKQLQLLGRMPFRSWLPTFLCCMIISHSTYGPLLCGA